MNKLYVQESHVNETKGYRYNDTEIYESCYYDAGALFRSCMREYGRCVSSVMQDRKKPDGGWEVIRVGWVFQKRVEYDDHHTGKPDTYLREVWVTLFDRQEAVESECSDPECSAVKRFGDKLPHVHMALPAREFEYHVLGRAK